MKIIAEITPIPLQRNQQGKYENNYLPERSRIFRENLQWILREKYRGEPLTVPLAVTLHFYKKFNPIIKNKYGDIDNLAKAVLDAGNEILWADDSQIIELHGFKHKGAGKIEIEVTECE